MSFLLHTRCQGIEKSLPTTVRRRNQWTSIVSTLGRPPPWCSSASAHTQRCRCASYPTTTRGQDRVRYLLQFGQGLLLSRRLQRDERGVRPCVLECLERCWVRGRKKRHDLDGTRIPTGLDRQFVQGLAAMFHLLQTDTDRHPAIAPRHDPLEDPTGRDRPQEDGRMRLLGRLRERADRGKVIIPPVVLGLLLRPEGLHRPDGLLGLRPAMHEVAPHDLRFLL